MEPEAKLTFPDDKLSTLYSVDYVLLSSIDT